jgi:hypothetical protein
VQNQNVIDSKNNVMEIKENVIEIKENVMENTNTKLHCKYCKKKFAARQNRWSHEKICKKKNENKNTDIIKNNIVNNNNTQNINNGTINNNTNNNVTNIIKFGSEDIYNILTKEQKLKIANCRLLALEESIKQTHFNKDKPEYQNVKINNLRSNVAHVYDGENFQVANQYSTIASVIDRHIESIEQILDNKNNGIPVRSAEKIEQLISQLDDEYKKIIDHESNRTFKNYKSYKIDTVKNLIYNESNKIKKIDNK